mmetsp:Transcript_9001/g.21929  ORF Transcript_9001/g.21929 Transcript_9001/m.21929 type:complete len:239 (+) Transcript_9001:773-1489(+)
MIEPVHAEPRVEERPRVAVRVHGVEVQVILPAVRIHAKEIVRPPADGIKPIPVHPVILRLLHFESAPGGTEHHLGRSLVFVKIRVDHTNVSIKMLLGQETTMSDDPKKEPIAREDTYVVAQQIPDGLAEVNDLLPRDAVLVIRGMEGEECLIRHRHHPPIVGVIGNGGIAGYDGRCWSWMTELDRLGIKEGELSSIIVVDAKVVSGLLLVPRLTKQGCDAPDGNDEGYCLKERTIDHT